MIYSLPAINARLQAVIDTIDANGSGRLVLRDSNGATLSTVLMQTPCGTVNAGVLTFTNPLVDPGATGTGTATSGVIQDGAGTTIVSGLSVGIPLSGADILLSNGLNSTLISAGQTMTVLGAQITGS
jgi:hypothetical protein